MWPVASQAIEPIEYLTNVRDDWVLTEAEALQWHQVKNENGPALTGNASWQQFVGFVEDKLSEYGVVDMQRNQWTFDRWHSTDWPDDSNWGLVSDGRQVDVANYGANSGATGPNGVTAELVFYDQENPPADITDKIVVFSTAVDKAAAKPPAATRAITQFGRFAISGLAKTMISRSTTSSLASLFATY